MEKTLRSAGVSGGGGGKGLSTATGRIISSTETLNWWDVITNMPLCSSGNYEADGSLSENALWRDMIRRVWSRDRRWWCGILSCAILATTRPVKFFILFYNFRLNVNYRILFLFIETFNKNWMSTNLRFFSLNGTFQLRVD